MRRFGWVLVVLVALGGPVQAEDETPKYEGRDAAAWAEDLDAADLDRRRKAVFALWNLDEAAKTAVPQLAEAIGDDDDYVASTAAKVLTKFQWMKAPGVLAPVMPTLAKALEDERAQVRTDAAQLLWYAGPPLDDATAVLLTALRKALKDTSPFVRANAAAALGNFWRRAEEALDDLKPLMRDESRDVRIWAVQSVGAINAKAALPELMASLKDNEPKVRAAAAGALGGLPPPHPEDVVDALLDRAEKDTDPLVRVTAVNAIWGMLPGRETVPRLLKLLESNDTGVRTAAAGALGAIGDPSSFDALRERFRNDDDTGVRAGAAMALGLLGPEAEPIVPELVRALNDTEPSVRSAAANALSWLPLYAAPAVPILIEALDSSDAGLRTMAASTLRQFAVNGGLRRHEKAPFVKALGSDDAEVRTAGGDVLLSVGANDPVTVEAFIAAYRKHDDYRTKNTCLRAFMQLRTNAAAATALLKGALPNEQQMPAHVAAALACVATDEKDVEIGVQTLIDLLADESYRLTALWSLGQVGPRAKRAEMVLQVWMKNDSRAFSINAAGSLSKIQQPASKAVLDALISDTKNPGPATALNYLADLGDGAKPAVPRMIELAGSADSGTRAAAVDALRRLGVRSPAAIAAIRKARNDDKAWVRMRAALALRELGLK